jgi:hypothetical protein
MQIAALAYDRLDPAVRAKVDARIKLNSDYSKRVEGPRTPIATCSPSSTRRPGLTTLRMKLAKTDSGDTPTSHNAARNIGYADKLRHKYWHYLDLPFSPDDTPVRPPDPVNALTQIQALKAVRDGHLVRPLGDA